MFEETLYYIQGPESERGPLRLADLSRAASFGNLTPDTPVRLSTGERVLARELGDFDFMPAHCLKTGSSPLNSFAERTEQMRSGFVVEYLITSWVFLLIGVFFLPIIMMPISFLLATKAGSLESRTAWIPASISFISWVACSFLAIQKSWSGNPF